MALLIATLGYTEVGYAVTVSILLSLGLTVLGLRRHQPGLWLAASVLSLFFAVAEAPSIGLFALPLPVGQFALGIWSLLRGSAGVRASISVASGLAFVLLAGRLIAHLL